MTYSMEDVHRWCIYLLVIITYIKAAYSVSVHWSIAEWSACSPRDNCQKPGYKTRLVSCQDRRGQVLPDEKCAVKLNQTAPRTFEYCVPDGCLYFLRDFLRVKVEPWSECAAVHLNVWNQVRNKITNRNETGEFPDCEKDAVGVAFVSEYRLSCTVHYSNEAKAVANVDSNTCAKTVNEKSRRWRFCFFACINTCALSTWSKWIHCVDCRRPRTRFKTREYMSLPKLKEYKNYCPKMVKVKNKKKSSRYRFQFKVSSWDGGSTIKDKKKHGSQLPKISLKQRSVVCIDTDGHLCNETSTEISPKRIMISDVDCHLSYWTEWSKCTSENKIINEQNYNKQIVSKQRLNNGNSVGQQTRRRSIKMLMSGDGKPCGPLLQKQSCSIKNDTRENFTEYKWFLGDWTPCTKSGHSVNEFKVFRCNVSFVTRHVFCIQIKHTKSGIIKPSQNSLCNHLDKPETKKVCEVSCDIECSYGSWNSWSRCRGGNTRRSRNPIITTKKCSKITQKKKCITRWEKTTSEFCIPVANSSICGQGFLNHTIDCKNGNNRIVNNKHCMKLPKPMQYENCNLTCVNNSAQKPFVPQITQKVSSSTWTHSNDDFFWYPSGWSKCALIRGRKASYTRNCVLAFSKRQVNCVNRTSTNVVNASFCSIFIKLRDSRRCTLCSKNCIVSEWSDWQPPCSAICGYLDSKNLPKTQRRRYVISHGNKFGIQCSSELVQTKECPPCSRYQWVAKKWDVCIHRLPPNYISPLHPDLMKGVQIRGVYCSDGEKMVDDEMCLKLRKPKPKSSRDCFIDLLVTCNLLPWTEWSECTRKCGKGVQQRTRSFMSDKCNVNKKMEYFQSRACNIQGCRDYFTAVGPWGACHQLAEPEKCATYASFNTLGIQFRNVSCHHTLDGTHVPNEYCEANEDKKIDTTRNCVVPCVRDCRLYEWSDFTACSKTCGTGISVRMRSINVKPSKGGKPCPLTENGQYITERVPCKMADCYVYIWVPEDWSPCVLEGINVTCGLGRRLRTIKCKESSTGRELQSEMCNPKHKPANEETCSISCAGQCVVSEWASWNNCTDACTLGKLNRGIKLRRRQILRQPTLQGGSCPLLEEQTSCEDCFTHLLKPSAWSSCILQYDDDICGIGIQSRYVDCYRSDGELVDPSHCSDLDPLPLHQECRVNCSFDCPLSAWTTWSECENTCDDVGYRTRERFILKKSMKYSSHCNEEKLKESLMCRIYPCYSLSLGEWEEKCKPLHKDSCGVGTVRRTAMCMRSDGNKVDLDYCLDYVTGIAPITKYCYVPCWNDCVLSEWSQWSTCFGVCNENFTLLINHGYRVKSRVIVQQATSNGRPCSKNLEITERCDSPKCFSFNSIVSDRITGTAQCMRSDGELLSYGCTPHKLPRFRCKCPLLNAKCIQEKYCQCDSGFYPQVNKRNNVVRCVSLNSKIKQPEMAPLNLPMIIMVVLIVFIGYCFMFIGITVLYKRHKNKSLGRMQDILNNEQFFTNTTRLQTGDGNVDSFESPSENTSPPFELENLNTRNEQNANSPVSAVPDIQGDLDDLQETHIGFDNGTDGLPRIREDGGEDRETDM